MIKDKKLHRLLFIKRELVKSIIANKRAIISIKNWASIASLHPDPNRQEELLDWGQKLEHAGAVSDLDIHSLVVSAYQFFIFAKREKSVYSTIPDETIEMIEIMRHHYEHWDKMQQFYTVKPGFELPEPPKGSNVERYYEKYRTSAKESPKGYLHVDYDMSVTPPKPFYIVGGAINLQQLLTTLEEIRVLIDEKIDVERANISASID